ncbi:hypothetical protein [Nannocystis punicea]|uniref:Dickkopf N-terminal cysteine-rich domain-containing protein n=1 Tax=Nannocystis punicea TaxID=2995304 RepID=A0ABY7H8H6_9BACT|nr:hypothetical protein [Nannocystis poenicansa]WAS95571.1 hypothetical protein O0S08_05365 [Nannocystis poenicansa]
MKKTIRGWVLGFGAAAAGCAQQATPENFAGEYEEALCAWATGCSVFQSRGQCRDALVWDTSGRFQYLLAALEADRVAFDAEAAEACLEQVSAQACDRDQLDRVLFFAGPTAAPAVCADVFVGKVRNYDPCLNSEECAGEAVCGFSPLGCDEGTCCAGACRVLAGAGPQIGEACTGSDCADDAFCARDPNTFVPTVCTARREAGESCADDGGSCVAAAYCDFDASICKARGQEGDDCSSGWVECAEGLDCYADDDDRRTCRALPNEGESCSNHNYRACARVDDYCDASSKCAKLPGPNEACADYQCLPYAECRGESGSLVCVALGSEGSDCGEASGYVRCIGHLQCGAGDRCVEPEAEPVCDVPE